MAHPASRSEIQNHVAGTEKRLNPLKKLHGPAKPREAAGSFLRIEDCLKIGQTHSPPDGRAGI